MRTILCVLALLLGGCFRFGPGNPDGDNSNDAAGTESEEPQTSSSPSTSVPSDENALFSFLRAGKYKTFKRTQLSALGGYPHDTSALRVYYNPALFQSLTAGNGAEHPPESAAIAERIDAQGNLRGWVVSVKLGTSSDGGLGWYWYAVDSTVDASQLIASGVGLGLCSNCHASGDDYVLSSSSY